MKTQLELAGRISQIGNGDRCDWAVPLTGIKKYKNM